VIRLAWIGIGTGDVHTAVPSDGASRDSRCSERRRNCLSILTFRTYCPVWVKIGVMPLSIYTFRKNRPGEDGTFRRGANETILTRVP
jgi:hypothetical protein